MINIHQAQAGGDQRQLPGGRGEEHRVSEKSFGGLRQNGWRPVQKQTEEKIPQPQQKLLSWAETWVYRESTFNLS